MPPCGYLQRTVRRIRPMCFDHTRGPYRSEYRAGYLALSLNSTPRRHIQSQKPSLSILIFTPPNDPASSYPPGSPSTKDTLAARSTPPAQSQRRS